MITLAAMDLFGWCAIIFVIYILYKRSKNKKEKASKLEKKVEELCNKVEEYIREK